MDVFVAMSGGVDSSSCLLLLKNSGHNVIGLTLRLDDDYNEPIKRAESLCKRFGVKHIVLDYRDEFKQEIIDKFNKKIAAGITPVPCVLCNRKIKFGKLIDFCRRNNGKLATGHYAKIKVNDIDGKKEYLICKAKDSLKDQTHFLCDIKKDVLQDVIFPAGEMFKSDIFRFAKENNLVQIDTYKESQEVCFFNGKKYTEYVNSLNLVNESGDIIHIDSGKKLGQHKGILKYTIGQRQGFGVSWKEPLYVVKKDIDRNILYVGEERFLYSKKLAIKNINILSNDILDKESFDCHVCLRDKTPIIAATVRKNKGNNDATVILKQPARAVTSGQMCAFYSNDVLLGGGEIIS